MMETRASAASATAGDSCQSEQFQGMERGGRSRAYIEQVFGGGVVRKGSG